MVVPIDIPTTSREENRGRRLRTDQRVSKSRDRWLRPIFGRREASITWAGSRDPLRYINGANTYQFVGSDPVGMVDPTGLWQIERQGQATARAISQSGDTIQGLAGELHLNPGEWKKWSNVISGTVPSSATQKLRSGCLTLTIPNTVDIDLGTGTNSIAAKYFPDTIFYQFRRVARSLAAKLTSLGYNVEYQNGTTNGEIALQLEVGTRSKALVGFLLFAHGSGGVVNATRTTGVMPQRYTFYGLAVMGLFACQSLTPSRASIPLHGGGDLPFKRKSLWAVNVAPDGKLFGYTFRANFYDYGDYTSEPGIWSTLPVAPEVAAQ